MPDSKGELKRYSIERNGQLYPFIDGEVVLASQALAALSTAEQRIEELEKEKAQDAERIRRFIDVASAYEERVERAGQNGFNRGYETKIEKLDKAEATIAEMKETHQRVVEIQMKELSDLLERNEALDALTKQQRTELTALRAEREKELRGFQEFAIDRIVSMLEEYHASGWDVVADRRGEPEQEQFDIIGYLKTFGAAPADMVAAFLAQKEGK